MKFIRLHIHHLRCLQSTEIALSPGLNFFVGANGAGKTSVLEAACLLSYARSFRSGSREALLQRGQSSLQVFGEVAHAQRSFRLGLGREGGRWLARVDGRDEARLSDLIQSCAVVCFEPGSHALIAGPADERRRFLDWGVFHVEHAFLATWQRYRRALKQRNVLLRAAGLPSETMFAPWEAELERCAQAIDAQRHDYLQRLQEEMAALCMWLLPELGDVRLDYRRGWAADRSLGELLREGRDRDRLRGHTTAGIHRADWRPSFAQAPEREHFSRGQEKLCALACLMAQAKVFAAHYGEWPILCLDDLASELDAAHLTAVLRWLRDLPAQILLTGTNIPAALAAQNPTVFHVEHGRVEKRG